MVGRCHHCTTNSKRGKTRKTTARRGRQPLRKNETPQEDIVGVVCTLRRATFTHPLRTTRECGKRRHPQRYDEHRHEQAGRPACGARMDSHLSPRVRRDLHHEGVHVVKPVVRQQQVKVLHRPNGAEGLLHRLPGRGELPQQGQVFPRDLKFFRSLDWSHHGRRASLVSTEKTSALGER